MFVIRNANVTAVIEKFKERAATGQRRPDRFKSAREELMDGILYLEKLKQTIKLD